MWLTLWTIGERLGSCLFLLVNLHLGIIYDRISLLLTITTQRLFLLLAFILHVLECFIGFHAFQAICCVMLVSCINVFRPALVANVLHLFIWLACVHDIPLLFLIPPGSCTVSRSWGPLSLLRRLSMIYLALSGRCGVGISRAHRSS